MVEGSRTCFLAIERGNGEYATLGMLNFELPFVIKTDASKHEIGAVLMQQVLPLSFISHACSDKSKVKPVHERELMAIVFTGISGANIC